MFLLSGRDRRRLLAYPSHRRRGCPAVGMGSGLQSRRTPRKPSQSPETLAPAASLRRATFDAVRHGVKRFEFHGDRSAFGSAVVWPGQGKSSRCACGNTVRVLHSRYSNLAKKPTWRPGTVTLCLWLGYLPETSPFGDVFTAAGKRLVEFTIPGLWWCATRTVASQRCRRHQEYFGEHVLTTRPSTATGQGLHNVYSLLSTAGLRGAQNWQPDPPLVWPAPLTGSQRYPISGECEPQSDVRHCASIRGGRSWGE